MVCYSGAFTPTMAVTREKSQLMSASEIDRTLVRLAHEILERTEDLNKLAFIGIRRRGVPLAQRLAEKIEALERRKVPVGILDINLYRDDLSTVSQQPVLNSTDIPFSVTGLDVITSCSFPAATSEPATVSEPSRTSKPNAAALAWPMPSTLRLPV